MKNIAPKRGMAAPTRRNLLKSAASIAALAAIGGAGRAVAADGEPEIVMDGHVHIVNRIYWEGIDPWTPQKPASSFREQELANRRTSLPKTSVSR